MNTDPVMAWREALRDDLRVAGPPAVQMLDGDLPLDPTALLAALQAAGLLDEATAGDPELARLRDHLVHAVRRRPERVDEALRALDLDIGLAAAEDRVDALHAVVALGGLANALPPGRARARVEDALAREEAEVALLDDGDAELAEAAARIADALDLAEDHPLATILALLAEPAPAPSEAAFAEGVRRAEARLFPSLLDAWVTRLTRLPGELGAWVRGVAAQPVLAFGGAGEPEPIPERRLLARTDEAEVCLLRIGGSLAIEWAGEGAPPVGAVLNPGATALASAPALVGGSAVWLFGAPPDGAPSVTLLFGDRAPWRVELA